MVNKREPSARPYRAELSAALDVSSRFLRPVQITADVMLGLPKHVIVNRISFWDRSQSSTRGSGMAKGQGKGRRTARVTAHVSTIEPPCPTSPQDSALYSSKPYPTVGLPTSTLNCLPVPSLEELASIGEDSNVNVLTMLSNFFSHFCIPHIYLGDKKRSPNDSTVRDLK